MNKKIIVSLFFILLIVFALCTKVNAKEQNNQYFSISVPDYMEIEYVDNKGKDDVEAYLYAQKENFAVSVSLVKKSVVDVVPNFISLTNEEGLKEYYNFLEKDESRSKAPKQFLYVDGCNAVKYRYTYDDTYFSDVYYIVSDNYLYQFDLIGVINDNMDTEESEKIVKSLKIKDTNNNVSITFNDVTINSWYFNAVSYVFTNNIIKGYNDTTFAPDDQLTRGMLATILYRMEGEQKVTGAPKFPDVQDSSKFYYKAVKWATDNNIVAGYNNGNFGPEDNITREQLAVILNRYASYKNKDVTKTNDLSKFSDTVSISDYAVNALKWAVGSGVITGNADRTLNPKGNATRAEVAAMMEKYCKNVGR